MNFGVPSQRKQRVEKHPNTPIMTLMSYDGSKGKGRKIQLNTAACDLLDLDKKDARIAFSFDNGLNVLNAEQKGVPKEFGIRVTKSYPRTISDKKTYEYIIKSQGLDETLENEYILKQNEMNDDSDANNIKSFNATIFTGVTPPGLEEEEKVDDFDVDTTPSDKVGGAAEAKSEELFADVSDVTFS